MQSSASAAASINQSIKRERERDSHEILFILVVSFFSKTVAVISCSCAVTKDKVVNIDHCFSLLSTLQVSSISYKDEIADLMAVAQTCCACSSQTLSSPCSVTSVHAFPTSTAWWAQGPGQELKTPSGSRMQIPVSRQRPGLLSADGSRDQGLGQEL